MLFFFFCFKQKTAYEMRISDWSSDVCSSDLPASPEGAPSIASFFIVIATDHPGMSEVRARVRPLHRIWLREHPGHAIYVVHGGPLLDTQGAMDGTLLVVQAAHIDDVHAFVAHDPYVQAGDRKSVV